MYGLIGLCWGKILPPDLNFALVFEGPFSLCWNCSYSLKNSCSASTVELGITNWKSTCLKVQNIEVSTDVFVPKTHNWKVCIIWISGRVGVICNLAECTRHRMQGTPRDSWSETFWCILSLCNHSSGTELDRLPLIFFWSSLGDILNWHFAQLFKSDQHAAWYIFAFFLYIILMLPGTHEGRSKHRSLK